MLKQVQNYFYAKHAEREKLFLPKRHSWRLVRDRIRYSKNRRTVASADQKCISRMSSSHLSARAWPRHQHFAQQSDSENKTSTKKKRLHSCIERGDILECTEMLRGSLLLRLARSTSTNRTINNKTMGHLRASNLIILYIIFGGLYFWKKVKLRFSRSVYAAALLLHSSLSRRSRKKISRRLLFFRVHLFILLSSRRAFCNSQSRKILRRRQERKRGRNAKKSSFCRNANVHIEKFRKTPAGRRGLIY